MSLDADLDAATLAQRPEGFQRVARLLAERGHAQAPRFCLSPAELVALTGAPVADIAADEPPARADGS